MPVDPVVLLDSVNPVDSFRPVERVVHVELVMPNDINTNVFFYYISIRYLKFSSNLAYILLIPIASDRHTKVHICSCHKQTIYW